MKCSKAEWAAIALTGGVLLFSGGWFARGAVTSGWYAVSGAHPPVEAVTPTPSRTFLPDQLLDLNTATSEQLMSLPGIGSAKAQAILDYRADRGPFRTPLELRDVPGIGESIYEGLKDYITVKEAAP